MAKAKHVCLEARQDRKRFFKLVFPHSARPPGSRPFLFDPAHLPLTGRGELGPMFPHLVHLCASGEAGQRTRSQGPRRARPPNGLYGLSGANGLERARLVQCLPNLVRLCAADEAGRRTPSEVPWCVRPAKGLCGLFGAYESPIGSLGVPLGSLIPKVVWVVLLSGKRQPERALCVPPCRASGHGCGWASRRLEDLLGRRVPASATFGCHPASGLGTSWTVLLPVDHPKSGILPITSPPGRSRLAFPGFFFERSRPSP